MPVLENINSEVPQGEFVTLVGASGCGKSTFLNMLLGIEKPTKGALSLEDEPIKAEPDGDRGIVFQRYSVFPHLTVRENILIAIEFGVRRFTAKLFGAARSKALERVNDLIERVGLAHASDKYPHELSGGMQQRLAIAQALIAKPRVLLLDEPFGALDPGIRNDMHVLVKELWQQENLTIFMVTHDLKEAFTLGTRLWVFDKVRHDPQAQQHYGAQITYDLNLSDSTIDQDKYNLLAQYGANIGGQQHATAV
jgi:NitT/TauT family transport system ATP-binding protein